MIPRIDVGFSALLGAVTALVSLAFSTYVLNIPPNPIALASLPVLAVVAVMGLVAYFFPTHKEIIAAGAGVIVVLVKAYLSARSGDAIDTGTVTAALTWIVQTVFLFALPRLQVLVSSRASGTRGTVYEVRREGV